MLLNTIHDRNGGSCQNCGWGSHCGTARYAEAQNYAIDGGEYTQVKICDHCRCNQCIPAIPKTYSIPKKPIATWKQLLKHMRDLSKR
tara:strand:- start:1852 stop:2112 length:261 start_codon:yes stop_codon:yes gene_type:complete